jgi:uncharacterized protein (TIGR03437 family)
MKCISVLLLSAACLLAQGGSFITGQAARLVIGQSTFTSGDPNSSDTVLGAASGIAFAGDTLIVADANRVGAVPANHRVLLFKGASSMFPSAGAELPYNRKCPICVGQASTVLGQPDFSTTTLNLNATSSSLRLPTAVSSDGVHLVIADTDHNRILIWNSIPAVNNQPADVVVGQPNFTSVGTSNSPTAKSLRGPQGVWILNGKLYIADTGDNRVLIYNHIPTSNGAAADVVLGAPNFTTNIEPDLSKQVTTATATNMLNPVAVSSDGVRLLVTDLGYNRVLVWNSIPTSNGAAADVALGQPNLVSGNANNGYSIDPNDTTLKETAVLCPTQTGSDTNGNPTYDAVCNATLSFPRFALSTGSQIFVADGGNDRVLLYNKIPSQSGASADIILGQIGGGVDQATNAADSLSAPMGLAWDGANLYVSDAFNRRITVYTPAATLVPYQGVTNAASVNIIANGTVTIGGTITANDVVTITINGTNYTYTVKSTDTVSSVVQAMVNAINSSNSGGGDPNAIASVDTTATEVVLTSRLPGAAGNITTYSSNTSTSATITAVAAGANLSGGADSAKIAPGTIVTISACVGWQSCNLSTTTAAADLSKSSLPTKLAGTQVYFNGIQAPLYFVSPFQINAQIPWEVNDTSSINAYVRTELSNGTQVTTPVAVTIVPANPGIFTQANTSPARAMAFHGSSSAVGIVSVDGTVTANDVATVTIQDRKYSYTVQSGDTLDTIRDNLVALINNGDPLVSASSAGVYDRIVLRARVEGPAGNGVPFGASESSGASVIMTAFGNGTLCCANVEGAAITDQNPAAPGEIIYVYATGLGLPVLNDTIASLLQTGTQWPQGGPVTSPSVAVSSLAGGSTADVISATMLPGTTGMFKVVLHLNEGLSPNSATPVTIAQDIYVSNIAYLPVTTQSAGSSSAPAAALARRSTHPLQSTQNSAPAANSGSNTSGGATPARKTSVPARRQDKRVLLP